MIASEHGKNDRLSQKGPTLKAELKGKPAVALPLCARTPRPTGRNGFTCGAAEHDNEWRSDTRTIPDD
jgi:hypothetical protein